MGTRPTVDGSVWQQRGPLSEACKKSRAAIFAKAQEVRALRAE